MAAIESSSPPQLLITEIPNRTCVKHFTCGVRDIDVWAKDKAYKFHSRNRAKVFCALRPDSDFVLGFYSLSLSPVQSNKLFGQDGDMYSDGHAPIAYIDWLAVRRANQGNKIGTLLLVDALRRAHFVSQHLPLYGVALRSLNDQTTRFYERQGFVIRETATHPLMIIPIWTLTDLFSTEASSDDPAAPEETVPQFPRRGWRSVIGWMRRPKIRR